MRLRRFFDAVADRSARPKIRYKINMFVSQRKYAHIHWPWPCDVMMVDYVNGPNGAKQLG